ncbi:hypothetical protein [Kitasatospora sp. NPDC057198]|uniref:hypothetical protein n=1 Tax=Kitasatospora sp. NPDC057198 TaxID=3346046 RepID=UPI003624EE9A
MQMLGEHIAEFGVAPDGRLFRAARGGVVLTKETAEVWKAARKLVLPPEQVDSPFADVPYSARHTAVSGWLTAGVDKAEVARRAGHSIAVLLRFYAKVINDREDHSNALIERFLNGDDLAE